MHLLIASTSIRGELSIENNNDLDEKVKKIFITHESLDLSSLPPAAVTVLSTHPKRVAFLVLLCKGLQ